MGLADALGCEDRVQLKVSDLMNIMRTDALNWAQNQCMINGLKAHLPHNHILIMVGEESTCTEEVGKFNVAACYPAYVRDDLDSAEKIMAKKKPLNNDKEEK